MQEIKKAKETFRFYTRLHLTELTGLKASTINQLLDLIKEVPGSCIYHHTHRFLQQHQYLSPEPPNDFAYWITNVLGEEELGERLAGIDTIQFLTIRSLREKIISTIEDYLKENPLIEKRFSMPGNEFYFAKSVSFVMPTEHIASDLKDFLEILKEVTLDSIYFHIFEARIRLEKGTNDFSYWLETSLGQNELAKKIEKLDPYTRTLDDLRNTIIKIVEGYL